MDKTAQYRAENKRIDALTGALNPLVDVTSGEADLSKVRTAWARMESIPFQVDGREDAIDNSFPGLDVRSYLTGDNSTGRLSVHDIIVPPGGGLPRVGLTEGDLFLYVIDGQPTITVGTLTEEAGPETHGYVPTDTSFALANTTRDPARLLCVFIPAGIELGFAAAHQHWVRTGDENPAAYHAILGRYGLRFDVDGALPNDARVNGPLEYLDKPIESGEDFEAMRQEWYRRPPVPRLISDRSVCKTLSIKDGKSVTDASIIFGGDDTRGRGMVMHGELGEGYTAMPHWQHSEEEVFFLVRGHLNLQVGTKSFKLAPGSFGFAPRGASHAFQNPGPGPCLLLTLNTPAGHEIGLYRFMEIVGGAKDPVALIKMMEDHGWVTHSPDWSSRWDDEETQSA